MQKVITSPPLVRTADDRGLRVSNGRSFMCLHGLRGLFEIPKASKYYILLSLTEWDDGDCVAVWIERISIFFYWGLTRETFGRFLPYADQWLTKHLDIPRYTKLRFYVRLEYED